MTRNRILDAAVDLLRTEELEELTMAAVAAQAGMTERTVYRHFATRDDLLAAVWSNLQGRVGMRGFEESATGLAKTALWLFPNFDKEEGAVRASVYSRAGRDVRRAVNDQRKAAVRAAVSEARPDLEGAALTRMCATVQLLASAYAWAVMKDFWGLSGEESGRAVSDAIASLLRIEPPADINP